MKKDIGFRFSEEAHARLIELAKKRGVTRTRVLEDLILGDLVPVIDAPENVRVESVKFSGGRKKIETVRPIVDAAPLPKQVISKGRGSIKRSQTIPKPDWKG